MSDLILSLVDIKNRVCELERALDVCNDDIDSVNRLIGKLTSDSPSKYDLVLRDDKDDNLDLELGAHAVLYRGAARAHLGALHDKKQKIETKLAAITSATSTFDYTFFDEASC